MDAIDVAMILWKHNIMNDVISNVIGYYTQIRLYIDSIPVNISRDLVKWCRTKRFSVIHLLRQISKDPRILEHKILEKYEKSLRGLTPRPENNKSNVEIVFDNIQLSANGYLNLRLNLNIITKSKTYRFHAGLYTVR